VKSIEHEAPSSYTIHFFEVSDFQEISNTSFTGLLFIPSDKTETSFINRGDTVALEYERVSHLDSPSQDNGAVQGNNVKTMAAFCMLRRVAW
jgi:hypothetical protein